MAKPRRRVIDVRAVPPAKQAERTPRGKPLTATLADLLKGEPLIATIDELRLPKADDQTTAHTEGSE